MVAQRGANRWSHADIHPAVSGNHHKGEIVLQSDIIQLAAALALPEHFHNA
ncbi:hypothetical protein D3C77_465240 [compost metagenome]